MDMGVQSQIPEGMIKFFKDTARDLERRLTKYLKVKRLRDNSKSKCEISANNNPDHG